MKAIAIYNENCIQAGQQRGSLEASGDVTLYAFATNCGAVSYVRHLFRQARKAGAGHDLFLSRTARSIFRGIEFADDLSDFEISTMEGGGRTATTGDAVVIA